MPALGNSTNGVHNTAFHDRKPYSLGVAGAIRVAQALDELALDRSLVHMQVGRLESMAAGRLAGLFHVQDRGGMSRIIGQGLFHLYALGHIEDRLVMQDRFIQIIQGGCAAHQCEGRHEWNAVFGILQRCGPAALVQRPA